MENTETEFYDKILTGFMELNSNGNRVELFKNQSIIELMTHMNSTKDKLFTKNALLLIMGLFDDNLNDTFYYNSENIKKKKKRNKDVLLTILEDEFIS
ncbi:MAG: hypothetical protein ACTSQD_01285 [Promethearchaeota archaeon]